MITTPSNSELPTAKRSRLGESPQIATPVGKGMLTWWSLPEGTVRPTLASLTKQRFTNYVACQEEVAEKAAKADDANVPTQLWDDRVSFVMGWTPAQFQAKSGLVNFWRKHMHRKW